jgi:lipoprotein-anchoring transpeptidase ErfK/SrfK
MLMGMDTDSDGLSDYDEINIYKTNAQVVDTDGDSYSDGVEVKAGYDPNVVSDEKAVKKIKVSLQKQELTYFLGPYAIKTFKISSGLKRTPTPKGEFSVLTKRPLVTYGSKLGSYYYPNTKWNLLFKYGSRGNLYIHGAYWHDKFGQPMSHGCINVSYSEMENLYNWADVGTRIFIEQ